MRHFFLGALILCAPSFAAAELAGGQFEPLWFEQISKAQADPASWAQSPFGMLGLQQDADVEDLSLLLGSYSPEQSLGIKDAERNAEFLRFLIDWRIHNLSEEVAEGRGNLKIASGLRSASKVLPWLDETQRQDLNRKAELAVKQHVEAEAKRLGISLEEADKTVKAKMSERALVPKSSLLSLREKTRLALRALQNKEVGEEVNDRDGTSFGRHLKKQEGEETQYFTLWQPIDQEDQGSEKNEVEPLFPRTFIETYFKSPTKEVIYHYQLGTDGETKVFLMSKFSPEGNKTRTFVSREIADSPYTTLAGEVVRYGGNIISSKDALHAYGILKEWVDTILARVQGKDPK